MNLASPRPRTTDPLSASPAAQPAPGTGRSELWMGVFFPDISLRAHQAPPDEPFAVTEKRQGRNLVYRANPSAMAQGIEPGMSLGATLVLCRELHSHERSLRLEERLLRRYAHVAAGFTPRVVLAGNRVPAARSTCQPAAVWRTQTVA